MLPIEFGFLGIFITLLGPFQILVSIRERLRFDRDGDGKISPNEEPFLVFTLNLPVKVDHPRYTDMSILSMVRVFIEAMMHSFCYGCTVVFASNLFILNYYSMDHGDSYLMVCMLIYMACMFLCMYATNGIHVVTHTIIHILYYGFAFVPLLFLWDTPENKYFMAVAAIFTLAMYIIGRIIRMKNSPGLPELCRLYQYKPESGKWIVASKPTYQRENSSNNETNSLVANDVGQLPTGSPTFFNGKPVLVNLIHWIIVPFPDDKSTLKALFHNIVTWAVVFPTYEIMHVLLSSAFTIGVLVGTATNKAAGSFGYETVSTTVLLVSVLLSATVAFLYQSMLYGKNENKMHKMVLGNFFPTTAAICTAMNGAAAVVIQLEPIETLEGTNTIVYYAGVAAMVTNLIITFGVAIWAYHYHRSQ